LEVILEVIGSADRLPFTIRLVLYRVCILIQKFEKIGGSQIETLA